MNLTMNIRHTTSSSFRILLLGPQHVGKSSVGSALAKKVHCPFFDTDTHILSQYAGTYKTIRELYTHLGAKKFKELEMDALTHMPSRCVCATGGGLSENLHAHAHIAPIYPKILLISTPEKIWPRIIANGIPAYIRACFSSEKKTPSHIDPDLAREKFIEIFHARVRTYKRLADYTIDLTDMAVDTVVETILSHLN